MKAPANTTTRHRSASTSWVSRVCPVLAVATLFLHGSQQAEAAEWTIEENDSRVEVRSGDATLFGWQAKPLSQPVGGEKFATSAFIHPLRTPSGFECTTIQPSDHLHHLGVWWPWKFIEVDGARHNCWEIQEGQGGNVAKAVKRIESPEGTFEWEFKNETEIRNKGKDGVTAIHETARVGFSREGTDAHVMDVSLRQTTAGKPVKIVEYRYSGFSWRGPATWDKDNSRMLTSEGRGRDDANGTVARWVMVTGPTPSGTATVLLMSAAAEIAASPERLRVWDSKAHKGAPFINFNPVMAKPLPLDDAHPAVSHRAYRVIAADREMNADAAEAAWRAWTAQRAKRGD